MKMCGELQNKTLWFIVWRGILDVNWSGLNPSNVTNLHILILCVLYGWTLSSHARTTTTFQILSKFPRIGAQFLLNDSISFLDILILKLKVICQISAQESRRKKKEYLDRWFLPNVWTFSIFPWSQAGVAMPEGGGWEREVESKVPWTGGDKQTASGNVFSFPCEKTC